MIERLDECLKVHADILDSTDIGDIYNLQDLAKLHYYLKVEHEFTPAEVEALLHFQDPLDVARWCWEENTHKHSFPICELLKEIDAYRLFPAFSPISQKDKHSELMKRLGQNYFAYMDNLKSLSNDALIRNAREIAIVQEVYAYLAEHYSFQPDEVEAMLRLDNPLHYIAERWPKVIYDTFPVEDKVQEDIFEISKNIPPQEQISMKERLQKAVQEAGRQDFGKKHLPKPQAR